MKHKTRLIKNIAIFLVLIAALIPATAASAALRICRTDPLVYFADGHKLSVSVSIAADAKDVAEIVYTVHAPAGSQVMKVVHTAGGIGLKETVVVVDDLPAGAYRVETIAFSPVEADVTSMVALLGHDYISASGHTNEPVVVTVTDGVIPTAANANTSKP